MEGVECRESVTDDTLLFPDMDSDARPFEEPDLRILTPPPTSSSSFSPLDSNSSHHYESEFDDSDGQFCLPPPRSSWCIPLNNATVSEIWKSYFNGLGRIPSLDEYYAIHSLIHLYIGNSTVARSMYAQTYANLIYLGNVSFAVSDSSSISDEKRITIYSELQKFASHLNESTYSFHNYFNKAYLYSSDALKTVQTPKSFALRDRTWAILSFDEFDLGKGIVDFSIRMNYSTLPGTSHMGRSIYAGTDHAFLQYYTSGFSTWQSTVAEYVVGRQTQNESGSPPPVYGSNSSFFTINEPFPVVAYDRNRFYETAGPIIALVLCMSMLYPVSRLVKAIVEEKESKTKETMKIMGLKDWALVLSWVITYSIVFTIISVSIALVLSSTVLQRSSFSVICVYIVLFGWSCITFAFLVSVFFSKAKLAGILAPILLTIALMPRYAYFSSSPNDSIVPKKVFSVLSPTAFAFGIDIFVEYEGVGRGIEWETVGNGAYSVQDSMVLMAGSIFLYGLLAFYLENVLPNEYGVKRKFYFLFTANYWLGKTSVEEANRVRRASSAYPWSLMGSHSLAHQHSPRDGGVHSIQHGGGGFFTASISDTSLGGGDGNGISPAPSLDEQVPVLVRDASRFERVHADLVGTETLSIRGLEKTYTSGFLCRKTEKHAVKGLTLDLYPNQITALLGHNGSGKSSTFSMLTGLLRPTGGDAIYNKNLSILTDLEEIRNSVGVCPQYSVLFPRLTVHEHLVLYATLKGVQAEDIEKEVEQAMADIGLGDKRDAYSRSLSGGMQRKLSIAIALIGGSKFVFLDEPSSGVDPHSRRAMWSLLRRSRKGRTILLTTHFMDEADLLADRIAVVSSGELQCVGSSLFLKSRYGVGYNMTLVKASRDVNLHVLTRLVKTYVPTAKVLSTAGGEVVFRLPMSETKRFPSLLRSIEAERENIGVGAYGVSMTTLEEVFLRIGVEVRKREEKEEAETFTSSSVDEKTELEKSPMDDSILIPVMNSPSPSAMTDQFQGSTNTPLSRPTARRVSSSHSLDLVIRPSSMGPPDLEASSSVRDASDGDLSEREAYEYENGGGASPMSPGVIFNSSTSAQSRKQRMTSNPAGMVCDEAPLMSQDGEPQQQQTSRSGRKSVGELHPGLLPFLAAHGGSGRGRKSRSPSPFNPRSPSPYKDPITGLSKSELRERVTRSHSVDSDRVYAETVASDNSIYNDAVDCHQRRMTLPTWAAKGAVTEERPLMRPYREMVRKRYICAKRDLKGRFFEIVLPVFVVAFALLILRLNMDPAGPSLRLSASLYSGNKPHSNHDNSDTQSLYSRLVGEGERNKKDTGRSGDLNDEGYTSEVLFSRQLAPGSASAPILGFPYDPRTSSAVLDTMLSSGRMLMVDSHLNDSSSLSHRLLEEQGYHALKRYGAYSFNDTVPLSLRLVQGNTTVLSTHTQFHSPATILFNTSSWHTMPSFSAELSDARLKVAAESSDASFTIRNHPLPLTFQTALRIRTYLSLFASLFLLIPFCYLPASFVLFIVKERGVKAKHQLLTTGVSPWTYWVANLSWDFVNYLCISLSVMLVLFAFENSAFVGSIRNAAATFSLFVLYGCAAIPLSYVYSFWFTKHTSAQIGVAGIHFITGFALVIVAFILDAIHSTREVNTILKSNVYRLFPPYNLGEGLIHLTKLEYSNILSGKDTSPFSWHVIGRSLVFLSVEAVCFFVLTLLLEVRFFSRVYAIFLSCIYQSGSGKVGTVKGVSSPNSTGSNSLSGARPSSGSGGDHYTLLRDPLEENKVNEEETVNISEQEEDSDVAAERERVESICASLSSFGSRATRRAVLDTVTVQNLRQVYPKTSGRSTETVAVKDLCLGIPGGECFGFLGVNGAGKTTTLKMLTGEITPSSGNAFIDAFSIVSEIFECRKRIGYCPQFDPLLSSLTAIEHLQMYGRLRGVPPASLDDEVGRLVRKLGLSECADRPSGGYSGGNKRKLSLAIALIGDPPVLFLDEPSTGMDPVARRFMWNVISSVCEERNLTVLLTTHSMEECEALCTRIGIMCKGGLQCLGPIQHLKSKFSSGYQLDMNIQKGATLRVKSFLSSTFPQAVLIEQHVGQLKYRLPDPSKNDLSLAVVFEAIEKNKVACGVVDYSISQGTLEQVFLKVVGEYEAKNPSRN